MLPVGPSLMDKDAALLRQSARTVTAALTLDEQQATDPWDLLQSSYSREYVPPGSPVESHFLVKQVHVIPDILLAQFGGKECKCFMGLLSEIDRVWMSIDNQLYLWDYATGRDFTCFDDLSHVIIDVALVKPREGVFIPSIKHLLVVITSAEVILLGVSFAGEGVESDLIIHKTGLFFSTDDVNMLSVVGSEGGRIFAGGQDGNLYEFQYNAEEGWITRKCRKINQTATPFSYLAPTFFRLANSSSPIISLAYDSYRNLLYALGDDSSIQTFYLGQQDSGFTKGSRLTDIVDQASRLCPMGLVVRKNFKLVSIHVIPPNDSAFIHLLAISSCGLKLYFTTMEKNDRMYSRSQILSRKDQVPGQLDLIHLRQPAEEGRSRDSRRMIQALNPTIHTTFYSQGVTLAANSIGKHEDMLVCSVLNQAAPSTNSRSPPFESSTDLAIEGKIWDIAKVNDKSAHGKEREGALNPKAYSISFADAYSSIYGSTRSFLLLSNAGVYTIEKTGPIDELQKTIIESNGNCESQALKNFVSAYGAEQCVFFCLVILCGRGSTNRYVSTRTTLDSKALMNLNLWITNILVKIGGEPKTIESSPVTADFVGGMTVGNSSRLEYEFSALHKGLYSYFARLTATFWGQSIPGLKELSSDLLMAMHSLYELLEKNSAFTMRSPPTKTPMIKGLEDAMIVENQSIFGLKMLIKRALELLSFLSICRDYGIILPSPRMEDGNNGYSVTINGAHMIDFEELLTTPKGRELISDMGAAIVQKQLKIKSSVDSLSQILLQRCPSFFGANEVTIFHGTESLERASHSKESTERNTNLEASLKSFLMGSKSLTLPVITDIVKKYQRLAFFPGVIELCLRVAAEQDPENVALLFWHNPSVVLTTEQQEKLNLRDSLYSLVFDVLRMVNGIETMTIMGLVGSIDVDALQRNTMKVAFQTKDELFHFKLYQWLVDNQSSSILIEAETAFVLSFLQEKFASRDDACRDLLWRYLAKRGQGIAAARVLEELAISTEFTLNLAERIERLSLALANAQSESRANVKSAEFIQDLEERLEVAKVQHELLENVLAQYGKVAEVSELNGTLFDISRLFNQYARPLKLWEGALLILNCSSYHDSLLLHQFWTNIIDQALDDKKRFDILAQKIARLAKRLYPSPFAFPLNFVLDSLFVLCIKYGQRPEWIGTTFSHTNIPAKDILGQMTDFLQGPATFWSKIENQEYLIAAFLGVVEKMPVDKEITSRLASAILSAVPASAKHVAKLKLAIE